MGHKRGSNGEQMAKKSDYLQFHGNQYRVRLRVPSKLVPIIGTTVLIAPLGTNDPRAADVLKHGALAKLKERLRTAEKAQAADDPLMAEALRRRLFIDTGNRRGNQPLTREEEDERYGVIDRAHQIERTHGLQRAKEFVSLATGAVTPLTHHRTPFVEFKAYPIGSIGELDRGLTWLSEWMKASHYPLTVEAVDRTCAANFLREYLMIGRERRTATKTLGFLREYWRWMNETGRCTENPWTGQTLPNTPRSSRPVEEDNGKRPFTDDELATLIYGTTEQPLADVMRISALSGMRIEEIFQLRVRDCQGNYFSILQGKTANAKRKVPVHPDLVEIVARRTEGKRLDAFLIDEVPDVPPKTRDSRSDPIIKRFTRYRRKKGVDERPNDKRTSNVDFHSFRRWFVRSARNAMLRSKVGFDEWTFTWVVGHTDGGRNKTLDMGQHRYAGQDPEKAKKALVESVTLPPNPNK